MALTNATTMAGLVGSALTFTPDAGGVSAGIVTASTFSGSGSDITGVTASGLSGSPNVTVGFLTATGSVTIGGTLTYDDVTNIDSVGLVTARNGLQVLAGYSTFTGPTIASDLNVTGFATVATLAATKVNFTGATETSNLKVSTGIATVVGQTNLANVNVSASSTFASATFGGVLVEAFSSTTTAWSSNANLNISNGNLQFCSANLGGTNNTLNIRSNTGINTDLAVGEAINVTAITAVNASTAYVNRISLDGNLSGITTYWVGGSVPSDGGSSGVDTYSFNILKLGNNTFTIVANQVKTS